MAVISPNTFLTLADLAATVGPDGKILDVVNLLSQNNEILDDMLFTEANGMAQHTFSILTGLPSSAWREFYQGVQPSKSTRTKQTAGLGILEGYSLVDKDMADMSGNAATYRLQEDLAQIDSMNQKMATTIFYGNAARTPAAFNGLSAHYSTVDPTKAENAKNVIDVGGVNNLSSLWLTCWGPNNMFGVFPKGSEAGLHVSDVTTDAPVDDGNGGKFQAYQTKYQWKIGLVLKDWRYAARVANIDVSLQTVDAANAILRAMTSAVYRMPTIPRRAGPVQDATKSAGNPLSFGKPAFYVNRSIAELLDFASQEKVNVRLKQEEFDGRPCLSFRGIPVRNVDALIVGEDRVV